MPLITRFYTSQVVFSPDFWVPSTSYCQQMMCRGERAHVPVRFSRVVSVKRVHPGASTNYVGM